MDRSSKFGAAMALVGLLGALTGCALLGSSGEPPTPFCADESVQGYVRILRSQNELAQPAARRLDELLGRLESERALIVVPDWRAAASRELSAIVHASRQVRLLRQPREELHSAHDRFRGAYRFYDEAANRVHRGLQATDATETLRGEPWLTKGRQRFERAQGQMREALAPCGWF